jgi:hypothetical protein
MAPVYMGLAWSSSRCLFIYKAVVIGVAAGIGIDLVG